MTDLETELARKSIVSISQPKVCVERAFLLEVLNTLRAKNKEIADLKARVPSRANPMAAAFAVNAAHGRTCL